MRTKLAVALGLFLIGATLHADDLSALLHSCGAGAAIETHPPSDYEDGLWHRTVEYKAGEGAADWMVVGFTAKSKKGPWAYEDSRFAKLPCLASSGIVPTQTQSRVQVSPATTQSTQSQTDGSGLLAFLLIALAVIGYIFPISIAMARGCKATPGIAVVNILLGWTFVGWVVALAWAASGEKRPSPVQPLG